MQITDVSLFRVSGRWSGPGFPPGDRTALQLDIYPEFNQPAREEEQPGQAHAL